MLSLISSSMRCAHQPEMREIAKSGVKDQIHLKKGIIGSERWGSNMRKRIHEECGRSRRSA